MGAFAGSDWIESVLALCCSSGLWKIAFKAKTACSFVSRRTVSLLGVDPTVGCATLIIAAVPIAKATKAGTR